VRKVRRPTSFTIRVRAIEGQQGESSPPQVERLAFHIDHKAAGEPGHRRGSADGSFQHAIDTATSDLAAYPVEALDANGRLSIQERELHAGHRLDGAQSASAGGTCPGRRSDREMTN